MNASSRTPEAITALVESLESHEGTFTDRERHLCTTLLHGLAAAGQLRIPAAPATGNEASDLPQEYNFEQATEEGRWAYDQGYEAGWDARLDPSAMDIIDIIDIIDIMDQVLTGLKRLADEQAGRAAEQKATRGRIEFEGAVIDLTEDAAREEQP